MHTEETKLAVDEAGTRLKLASIVDLDPNGIEAALGDMRTAVNDPSYPKDLRKTDWVLSNAASNGARKAMLPLVDETSLGFDRKNALYAAIGLGDLASSTRLAAIPVSDAKDYELDFTRGVIACLSGAKDGLKALTSAKQKYFEVVTFEYREAQVAALACGEPAGSEHATLDREAIWLADQLAEPHPDGALDHIRPGADYDDRAHDGPDRFFALAYAAGAIPSNEDAIVYARLAADAKLPIALTPWSGVMLMNMIGFDPAPFETSADRLVALADALDAGTTKLAPLTDEELEGKWLFVSDVAKEARKHPSATLRLLATELRVEAIAARASVHDVAATKKLASLVADHVEGAVALFVGASLVRVGASTDAHAFFAKSAPSSDPEVRFYAHLNEALLQIDEGRPRDAMTAVAKATEVLAAANAANATAGLGDLVDLRRSIGWVSMAASLLAGETAPPAIVVDAPKYFVDTDQGEKLTLPSDWWSLAHAADDVRRVARFRMLNIDDLGMEERAVLPAVVYVMTEVARDGKDPSTWVDAMLPVYSPQNDGATAARARAEAARWRKNEAEAKAWDDRAAKIEALAHDPKTALLLRLVHLE